jgi:hypothetical protein
MFVCVYVFAPAGPVHGYLTVCIAVVCVMQLSHVFKCVRHTYAHTGVLVYMCVTLEYDVS